jgi:hypothetical protein
MHELPKVDKNLQAKSKTNDIVINLCFEEFPVYFSSESKL